MNFILSIPSNVRMAILFVIGAIIGSQINRGIYRLAICQPRRIGPWSRLAKNAPPRSWFDLIPILGWFTLSREEKVHGKGFWMRPVLIEFFCAMGLMWLYYWETEKSGILPQHDLATHVQFLAHAVLISLLMVATFIDFDEQMIPDSITVPGTLIGLLFAATVPFSRLPIIAIAGPKDISITSPLPWPEWLNEAGGLTIGILCIVAWCVAVLPIYWHSRHGSKMAMRYMMAWMFTSRRMGDDQVLQPRKIDIWNVTVFVTLFVGPIYVALVWWVGGDPWTSLLSALVGMVFSGGMIWAVRIIGKMALGKEAMGFGDVTLMAMVGAFFGWQASLMVFFLAPFASVGIALAQFLFTGRTDIAFGPYLAFGSVILLMNWQRMWPGAELIFAEGWLIPMMIAVCLVLMYVLLLAIQWLKPLLRKLAGMEQDESEAAN